MKRIAVLALAIILPVTAIAQDAQPISYVADKGVIYESELRIELEGNVNFKRGNLTLDANKVVIYSRKQGEDGQEFDYLVATGNVRAKSGPQTVTSNTLTYTGDSEVALFEGNVKVKQGGNTANANQAEFNLKSGVHRLIGPVKGQVTGTLP